MTSNQQIPVPAESWQTASVSAIIQRTERIKSFFFDLQDPIVFVPGQHIDVRLTSPDGYSAVRSYSIASAPDNAERIELAIELLQDGEVSPFFHETVRTGDAIDLRGPLGGHFIWTEKYGGPLLLLGGGSGVVPLLSMLRYRKATKSTIPAILLLSSRTWDDVPFRDELLAMENDSDEFHVVFTLTRDRRHRERDYERRVDPEMMKEVVARLCTLPRLVYACGTNQFVDSAVDAAIRAGLSNATDIRTERYGA